MPSIMVKPIRAARRRVQRAIKKGSAGGESGRAERTRTRANAGTAGITRRKLRATLRLSRAAAAHKVWTDEAVHVE